MINIGVKGEYQVQVLNAEQEVTQDSGLRPNMILDSFFEITKLITPFAVNGNYLRVGTGTTPPQPTDTTLQNTLASSYAQSSNNTTRTFENGTWSVTLNSTFQFPLGSVVGNISELGYYLNGMPTNTVQTRALITDANGNPTTITVTSQEQLIVTYKITVSGVDVDYTGTVNIGGTTHNWLARRAWWFNITLNEILSLRGSMNSGASAWGVPSTLGAAGVNISTSVSTASLGTIMLSPSEGVVGVVKEGVTANINQGNTVGGIQCIGGVSSGGWKFEFNPPIPKDNTKTFSLNWQYNVSRL